MEHLRGLLRSKSLSFFVVNSLGIKQREIMFFNRVMTEKTRVLCEESIGLEPFIPGTDRIGRGSTATIVNSGEVT